MMDILALFLALFRSLVGDIHGRCLVLPPRMNCLSQHVMNLVFPDTGLLLGKLGSN